MACNERAEGVIRGPCRVHASLLPSNDQPSPSNPLAVNPPKRTVRADRDAKAAAGNSRPEGRRPGFRFIQTCAVELYPQVSSDRAAVVEPPTRIVRCETESYAIVEKTRPEGD